MNGLMGIGSFGSVGSLGVGVDPVSMGISAGVSLASTALGSWLADKRASGLAKTYSTSIVNSLEPLLNANKNAYLAGPGTCADQTAALTAFDSAMAWLQGPQACGNLQLGSAGQNCINDRMPGGKWDWYAMYRDPIANDTRPQCNLAANAGEQAAVQNLMNKISGSNVQVNAGAYQVDPTTGLPVGSSPVSTSGTVMGIPTEYLVLGGAAVLLVMVMS